MCENSRVENKWHGKQLWSVSTSIICTLLHIYCCITKKRSVIHARFFPSIPSAVDDVLYSPLRGSLFSLGSYPKRRDLAWKYPLTAPSLSFVHSALPFNTANRNFLRLYGSPVESPLPSRPHGKSMNSASFTSTF